MLMVVALAVIDWSENSDLQSMINQVLAKLEEEGQDNFNLG